MAPGPSARDDPASAKAARWAGPRPPRLPLSSWPATRTAARTRTGRPMPAGTPRPRASRPGYPDLRLPNGSARHLSIRSGDAPRARITLFRASGAPVSGPSRQGASTARRPDGVWRLVLASWHLCGKMAAMRHIDRLAAADSCGRQPPGVSMSTPFTDGNFCKHCSSRARSASLAWSTRYRTSYRRSDAL